MGVEWSQTVRARVGLLLSGERPVSDERAGGITTEIPNRGRHHAFGPPRKPVVWRFYVLETQPFHGQLLGFRPLQLGRGGSGLSQERCAAQAEAKLSAVHAATSLPKTREGGARMSGVWVVLEYDPRIK